MDPTSNDRQPAPDDRRDTAVALATALVVALAHVALRLTEAFPVGVFSDDGIYVSLGKALAEGDGYRSMYAVGSPPHVKYPPVVPVLFAALWKLTGNLEGFRAAWHLTTPVLTGAATFAIALVGRRMLRLPWGLTLVLGVGPLLADPALHYLNLPISEGLFLALWAVFTLALANSGPTGTGRWVLVVVLCAVAPLLRAQGLALVVTAGLVYGFRRSLRWGVTTVAVSALPFVVWSAMRPLATAAITQPDELPYVSWVTRSGLATTITSLGSTVLTNVRAYFWILTEHLSPWPAVGAALALALVALAVVGAAQVRASDPQLTLPVVLTSLLILVWPWPQDRFLLTLLPFSGLLAATALARMGRPRRVTIAVALLVASAALRQTQVRAMAYAEFDPEEHRRVGYPSHFLMTNARFLLTTVGWLQENAGPDDRIVTPLHGGVHLYTGLKTIPASPADPSTGSSVFRTPGAYLSSRILADGATVAALGDARSPMAHDVRALRERCPESVQVVGNRMEPSPVVFYRLTEDASCMEPLAAKLEELWN